MKVEFLVEDTAYYNSDMEYKIVESYHPDDLACQGYDIYRVETNNISDIRVVNEVTGIEYEAEQATKCKDGIYVVTVWNPVA